jgi:hypothetical protein
MMNRIRKFVVTILILACLLGLQLYFHTSVVPDVRRMADLAGAETIIELKPDFYPPYNLLIGVPSTSATPPQFVGTLQLTSSDGSTATIAIDSENSMNSNWLRSPTETGYILGWGRQPRLSEVLQQGKSFRLRVLFEGAPPPDSSLWFSSMRRVTIFGDKKPNKS